MKNWIFSVTETKEDQPTVRIHNLESQSQIQTGPLKVIGTAAEYRENYEVMTLRKAIQSSGMNILNNRRWSSFEPLDHLLTSEEV